MLTTVIFDMDGLLIDSEPFWREAAKEIFATYNIHLSDKQYSTTTGLRTREFVPWWLSKYDVPEKEYPSIEEKIVNAVIRKVQEHGKVMPGVNYIFEFFRRQNFKIGLASSSNETLINIVIERLGIGKYLHAIASAENLVHGKPHPQVYLNCAETLQSNPSDCLCFEDSFNGMIAALAARMRCIVVPAYSEYKLEKWGAANLKLSSLQNFSQLHLDILDE